VTGCDAAAAPGARVQLDLRVDVAQRALDVARVDSGEKSSDDFGGIADCNTSAARPPTSRVLMSGVGSCVDPSCGAAL
jgi:hypothetical protein